MSWMDESWRLIDRPTVAITLDSTPPMAFVIINGAHCYGFASADSDIGANVRTVVRTGERGERGRATLCIRFKWINFPRMQVLRA